MKVLLYVRAFICALVWRKNIREAGLPVPSFDELFSNSVAYVAASRWSIIGWILDQFRQVEITDDFDDKFLLHIIEDDPREHKKWTLRSSKHHKWWRKPTRINLDDYDTPFTPLSPNRVGSYAADDSVTRDRWRAWCHKRPAQKPRYKTDKDRRLSRGEAFVVEIGEPNYLQPLQMVEHFSHLNMMVVDYQRIEDDMRGPGYLFRFENGDFYEVYEMDCQTLDDYEAEVFSILKYYDFESVYYEGAYYPQYEE